MLSQSDTIAKVKNERMAMMKESTSEDRLRASKGVGRIPAMFHASRGMDTETARLILFDFYIPGEPEQAIMH